MDSLHRSPLPPACHQQSQRVTECYTSLVHARGLTCETLKSSRRPAHVAAENWIGNSQKPFSSLKTPRKAMRKEVSLAGLQCFPSLSIFTGPRKIRHLGPGPAGTLQPSGSSLPPGLLVLHLTALIRMRAKCSIDTLLRNYNTQTRSRPQSIQRLCA